jgi:hypothetical protein
MRWTTIEQLVKDLGLSVESQDIDHVKSAIDKELKLAHPDKFGGDFPSAEIRTRFFDLSAAREWLFGLSNTQNVLVPISQLNSLIATLGESQRSETKSEVRDLINSSRDEQRRSSHERYFFPKLGSGILGGLCTFLWSFPTVLKDHELLMTLFGGTMGQAFLADMTLLSTIAFIVIWFQERREELVVENLMTEQGRTSCFKGFLFDLADGRPLNVVVVTLNELTAYVQDFVVAKTSAMRHGHHPLGRIVATLFRPKPKTSVMEKIASATLLDLEQRQLLTRVQEQSFEVVYRLNEAAINQLEGNSPEK